MWVIDLGMLEERASKVEEGRGSKAMVSEKGIGKGLRRYKVRRESSGTIGT